MAFQIALGVAAGIYFGYILIRGFPTFGSLLHAILSFLTFGTIIAAIIYGVVFFRENPILLFDTAVCVFGILLFCSFITFAARLAGLPEKWAWIVWNIRNRRP
jgi:hypothetical protein